MAKLPNRLVIEITNADKVDELGCPVIGFESKDYAECIIEELEKIKVEMEAIKEGYIRGIDYLDIIDEHISELKGE